MTDTKLMHAYMGAEEKRRRAAQSAEDKRRRAAIMGDRDTIPMDFSAPSSRLCASARESSAPTSDPVDPLWKRIWKTEGIRWLGPREDGMPDAMERFEHAFMLGYKQGIGDMLRELQGDKE